MFILKIILLIATIWFTINLAIRLYYKAKVDGAMTLFVIVFWVLSAWAFGLLDVLKGSDTQVTQPAAVTTTETGETNAGTVHEP